MSVHYRFKSTLEYDTITIDGLHISVKDLKNAIIQQKRIGKSTDFDLMITNAQTQEVYEDENALIPKNTSLLIARVPVTAPKQKQWEGYGGSDAPPTKVDEGGPVSKAMDLSSLDAPEDDKIKAMMSQSTQDYDPSNYIKIRGANQVGPVPASYRCYKCYQTGHWIKDCPLQQGSDPVEIKKSTGIPHSFLIPVEGPQVPGAMMMANGQYAVSALDLQAFNQKSSGPVAAQEPKPDIPEDLLCSICSDLLTDAVMIPCCGNSFCDECIRSFLLDSEEHECPDCHEKEISPATLIPNRFLRKSVANFKNTTGYEKKPVFKLKPDITKEEPPKKEATPPTVDAKEHLKEEEKTVISEADSTEHDKNGFSKDIELDLCKSKSEDPDGPPGVSPGDSPNRKTSHKDAKNDKDKSSDKERARETEHRSHKSRRSRSVSPRKSRSRRSPSYESRRISERHHSGTPTRDEPPPGIGNNNNYAPPPVNQYPVHGTNIPPPGMPPMQGHPVPMQFPPNQPPPYHPPGAPPNFRLPPPGAQPPPFMPPGYQGARPVFDPMVGNFATNYGGRRDYGRRGRERTPPGVIDDPLAAFNRILREKDEKRARQQRMAARRSSWSRSRSRSFSRSPPPLRRRSRSPRRRKSRSRSRSFSMSRSRSRSYSKSPGGRGSPSSRRSPLQLSQHQSVARRGASGRFRSPIRSPPPNRRRIDRDRHDYGGGGGGDRDYDRNFREKTRSSRRGDSRDRYFDDRDHHHHRGGGDYDRGGGRNRAAPAAAPPPQQQQPQWTPAAPPRDAYYPPPQDQPGAGYQQNRFPQQIHRIQPDRKYPEIAPVVEQPPIPGLESELPPVNEFEKKKSPEIRKEKEKHSSGTKESDKDRRSHRERKKETKPRSRSRSKTPDKWRNPSPRGTTPEKPRKTPEKPKKSESKKRDASEDDKRKSKDKKKHREKKEDKKKKKDKKEKHHKSKKDKKETEFVQVIPRGDSNDEETSKKKSEEKRKLREEEEQKRIAEERKKEERRLRFIEDEKLKREELLRKEEAKRKSIEEARKVLEEEEKERQKELETQEKKTTMDLYDEVIAEKDLATEIHEDFNIDQKVEEATIATPVEQQEKEAAKPITTKEKEKLFEEEEEDLGILELHSDMDIKLDDTDILAPLPEKSKWEEDEDGQPPTNTPENKEPSDSKSKVSNEVLKRAENVIFARAINSIRPLEVKKAGAGGGERSKISFEDAPAAVVVETKPKLSIKQRLGIKVEEPEAKVKLVERTPSPFNRRRIVIDTGSKSRRNSSRSNHNRDKERHDKSRRSRTEDKEKRKRTRSRSESDEHKKKKRDKKPKKDKPKKEDNNKTEEKPKTIEKRKPTLDEANFEPDYDDLEIHETSEAETKNKIAKEARKSDSDDSSSSDSSSSSSEEERKRKKRKSKKKRKRKESSSSESDSSSESSESDRDRKRRKHKKSAKKKKKKSKHK